MTFCFFLFSMYTSQQIDLFYMKRFMTELIRRQISIQLRFIWYMLINNSRWVLHGELHDTCKEFFVGCKTASSQAGNTGNMWLDTYFLRPSMVPTFLSRILAERALVIGKSINFIRLCIHKCPRSKSVKMKVRGQVSFFSLLLYQDHFVFYFHFFRFILDCSLLFFTLHWFSLTSILFLYPISHWQNDYIIELSIDLLHIDMLICWHFDESARWKAKV